MYSLLERAFEDQMNRVSRKVCCIRLSMNNRETGIHEGKGFWDEVLDGRRK